MGLRAGAGEQLRYAVFGALFMPLLAVALLVMNNWQTWVGREFRSGWAVNLALVATLGFFAWVGGGKLADAVRRLLA